ncbi:ParB/RepB/Spo0J family partition protein [Halocatena halophila]|uniref:ParB/RepB/Spo0J family partition protein n=1 Tax=Halocatena halophila TaxID=2814576 RepID=UPI002ED2254B
MTDNLSLDDLPQPEWQGTVSPQDLDVDGDNPNELNPGQFDLLCENIQRKGWVGNAIVTDTDGLIADGEHRWRAALELGLDAVPVKQYDLDDAQRRFWRQELNKIRGEHDPARDEHEFEKLLESSYSDDLVELLETTDDSVNETLEELDQAASDPSGPDAEWQEFDESVEADIEYTQCPECGHEFIE